MAAAAAPAVRFRAQDIRDAVVQLRDARRELNAIDEALVRCTESAFALHHPGLPANAAADFLGDPRNSRVDVIGRVRQLIEGVPGGGGGGLTAERRRQITLQRLVCQRRLMSARIPGFDDVPYENPPAHAPFDPAYEMEALLRTSKAATNAMKATIDVNSVLAECMQTLLQMFRIALDLLAKRRTAISARDQSWADTRTVLSHLAIAAEANSTPERAVNDWEARRIQVAAFSGLANALNVIADVDATEEGVTAAENAQIPVLHSLISQIDDPLVEVNVDANCPLFAVRSIVDSAFASRVADRLAHQDDVFGLDGMVHVMGISREIMAAELQTRETLITAIQNNRDNASFSFITDTHRVIRSMTATVMRQHELIERTFADARRVRDTFQQRCVIALQVARQHVSDGVQGRFAQPVLDVIDSLVDDENSPLVQIHEIFADAKEQRRRYVEAMEGDVRAISAGANVRRRVRAVGDHRVDPIARRYTQLFQALVVQRGVNIRNTFDVWDVNAISREAERRVGLLGRSLERQENDNYRSLVRRAYERMGSAVLGVVSNVLAKYLHGSSCLQELLTNPDAYRDQEDATVLQRIVVKWPESFGSPPVQYDVARDDIAQLCNQANRVIRSFFDVANDDSNVTHHFRAMIDKVSRTVQSQIPPNEDYFNIMPRVPRRRDRADIEERTAAERMQQVIRETFSSNAASAVRGEHVVMMAHNISQSTLQSMEKTLRSLVTIVAGAAVDTSFMLLPDLVNQLAITIQRHFFSPRASPDQKFFQSMLLRMADTGIVTPDDDEKDNDPVAAKARMVMRNFIKMCAVASGSALGYRILCDLPFGSVAPAAGDISPDSIRLAAGSILAAPPRPPGPPPPPGAPPSDPSRRGADSGDSDSGTEEDPDTGDDSADSDPDDSDDDDDRGAGDGDWSDGDAKDDDAESIELPSSPVRPTPRASDSPVRARTTPAPGRLEPTAAPALTPGRNPMHSRRRLLAAYGAPTRALASPKPVSLGDSIDRADAVHARAPRPGGPDVSAARLAPPGERESPVLPSGSAHRAVPEAGSSDDELGDAAEIPAASLSSSSRAMSEVVDSGDESDKSPSGPVRDPTPARVSETPTILEVRRRLPARPALVAARPVAADHSKVADDDDDNDDDNDNDEKSQIESEAESEEDIDSEQGVRADAVLDRHEIVAPDSDEADWGISDDLPVAPEESKADAGGGYKTIETDKYFDRLLQVARASSNPVPDQDTETQTMLRKLIKCAANHGMKEVCSVRALEFDCDLAAVRQFVTENNLNTMWKTSTLADPTKESKEFVDPLGSGSLLRLETAVTATEVLRNLWTPRVEEYKASVSIGAHLSMGRIPHAQVDSLVRSIDILRKSFRLDRTLREISNASSAVDEAVSRRFFDANIDQESQTMLFDRAIQHLYEKVIKKLDEFSSVLPVPPDDELKDDEKMQLTHAAAIISDHCSAVKEAAVGAADAIWRTVKPVFGPRASIVRHGDLWRMYCSSLQEFSGVALRTGVQSFCNLWGASNSEFVLYKIEQSRFLRGGFALPNRLRKQANEETTKEVIENIRHEQLAQIRRLKQDMRIIKKWKRDKKKLKNDIANVLSRTGRSFMRISTAAERTDVSASVRLMSTFIDRVSAIEASSSVDDKQHKKNVKKLRRKVKTQLDERMEQLKSYADELKEPVGTITRAYEVASLFEKHSDSSDIFSVPEHENLRGNVENRRISVASASLIGLCHRVFDHDEDGGSGLDLERVAAVVSDAFSWLGADDADLTTNPIRQTGARLKYLCALCIRFILHCRQTKARDGRIEDEVSHIHSEFAHSSVFLSGLEAEKVAVQSLAALITCIDTTIYEVGRICVSRNVRLDEDEAHFVFRPANGASTDHTEDAQAYENWVISNLIFVLFRFKNVLAFAINSPVDGGWRLIGSSQPPATGDLLRQNCVVSDVVMSSVWRSVDSMKNYIVGHPEQEKKFSCSFGDFKDAKEVHVEILDDDEFNVFQWDFVSENDTSRLDVNFENLPRVKRLWVSAIKTRLIITGNDRIVVDDDIPSRYKRGERGAATGAVTSARIPSTDAVAREHTLSYIVAREVRGDAGPDPVADIVRRIDELQAMVRDVMQLLQHGAPRNESLMDYFSLDRPRLAHQLAATSLSVTALTQFTRSRAQGLRTLSLRVVPRNGTPLFGWAAPSVRVPDNWALHDGSLNLSVVVRHLEKWITQVRLWLVRALKNAAASYDAFVFLRAGELKQNDEVLDEIRRQDRSDLRSTLMTSIERNSARIAEISELSASLRRIGTTTDRRRGADAAVVAAAAALPAPRTIRESASLLEGVMLAFKDINGHFRLVLNSVGTYSVGAALSYVQSIPGFHEATLHDCLCSDGFNERFSWIVGGFILNSGAPVSSAEIDLHTRRGTFGATANAVERLMDRGRLTYTKLGQALYAEYQVNPAVRPGESDGVKKHYFIRKLQAKQIK